MSESMSKSIGESMRDVGGAAIRDAGRDENRDAVLVDAVRTPFGRQGGVLAGVRPDDLAAIAIRALVARTRIDPVAIDDVILGCANQAGEDSRNVARMSALLAGLPITVPGQTVNRLCGSGLQAVLSAAQAIRAGDADCVIAGGVESMTRAPWVTLKPDRAFPRGAPEVADSALGWRFTNPAFPSEWTVSLGETAERVAEQCGVTREEQDAFALETQRRAAAAIAAGRFDDEVVAVGDVTRDEHPRPDVTAASLAAMRPAFRVGGTVTAGTSSGINDGAAVALVMSAAAARRAGLVPLARVVTGAAAGVAPDLMGLGPVPAIRAALERAGLAIDVIDLVELNEAFAAQAIACQRALGLDPARVNVNGGAIALGHPLGASGARLIATLAHEMRRRGSRRGVAAMCIGVGQGLAVVLERS